MKYVGYSFWGPGFDVGKVIAKKTEIDEEREKFPDRYPKFLRLKDGAPVMIMLGQSDKALQLYEATEEQLINLTARWIPEVRWEFVPLLNKGNLIEAFHKLPSLDLKNQPHEM